MLRPRIHRRSRVLRASVLVACGMASAAAQPTPAQVEALLEQNRQLQEQVRAQQRVIDALHAQMTDVVRASERHDRELRGLSERIDGGGGGGPAGGAAGFARGAAEVRISAEAAFTYFRTGRNGQFPEGEFRADDPTVRIEAPVMKDVYFFTELNLLRRETNSEAFELGEMYVDFENVSARWGQPGLLSVRAGRINIPFGEEYQRRGPLANPLISHSLPDIWGVDEGLEVYGSIGPASYVLAVQNGGVSRLRDHHRDKAVTARVGWQPRRWLHVSASAMRTGKLAVADNLSEVWFGNGFFRALGNAGTTATFGANLYQADATARWKRGHASVSLGQVRFDDSDTRNDNSRRIRYGSLEAVQDLVDGLYAAVRYSEIDAPKGYPLVGWAPMGPFFFRPGVLTEELHRLSAGLGYRFGPSLVVKVEYSWESGRMTTGARRDHEDFFGTQLGVKF